MHSCHRTTQSALPRSVGHRKRSITSSPFCRRRTLSGTTVSWQASALPTVCGRSGRTDYTRVPNASHTGELREAGAPRLSLLPDVPQVPRHPATSADPNKRCGVHYDRILSHGGGPAPLHTLATAGQDGRCLLHHLCEQVETTVDGSMSRSD
eukprot:gene11568-biopygen21410